jgi:hypothetical protein
LSAVGFGKLVVNESGRWLRENSRSVGRRATKEFALAALANLSCAGGILFAFIFCPNDQENGFHAANYRTQRSAIGLNQSYCGGAETGSPSCAPAVSVQSVFRQRTHFAIHWQPRLTQTFGDVFAVAPLDSAAARNNDPTDCEEPSNDPYHHRL